MANVTLETLRCGLRAILVPCEAQSVAVGIFVKSGSRHETEKTAGISHLIEHMLFKGTRRRSQLEITQAIEGRGGNFNAWTSEESTAYFTHMPFEYLDESVDILADMYRHAAIPADEFVREKQVVIEEIKMYADEPDSVAAENLQRALFPKCRLGAPVAGSAASLAPLKPADLKAYVRAHYRPDNTIAVIAGKFDADAARKALERAFRGFGQGARGAAAKDGKPGDGTCVPRVVAEKDIQQAQLALGYRTFGVGDQRKYAATVFDAVMGRGMSSRLFQNVRERRGLSYDISSRMQFFTDAGMWSVTAGLDAAKVETTLRVIDGELRRIQSKRVAADELRRAQEFLTGNFRLSHEKVQSKLFFYAQCYLAFGRIVDPEEQVEGIRAVTADDLRDVAQAILEPKNRSLSLVLPKGTGRKDASK